MGQFDQHEPQIPAGCLHESNEVQARLKIANVQYNYTKFNAALEKSKFIKKENDGSTTNSHNVFLKTATANGQKVPNINIIMAKDLKSVKTVVRSLC